MLSIASAILATIVIIIIIAGTTLYVMRIRE